MNSSVSTAVDDAVEGPRWTTEDAEQNYHIDAWGESYYFVNDAGHAAVRPVYDAPTAVDLYDVVKDLKEQGAAFPVLIRFQDLLTTRVVQLNESFRKAIAEAGYGNRYVGVYPIKVNQMHEVVEEILEAGKPYDFGLECGSKAELMATLPHLHDDETLLICNGYKDAYMQRLILTMQALGKKVVPVIEKYHEFEAFMDHAADMDIAPRFGVRIRLATSGAGKWEESGGDHSKFGISAPELLLLIDRLQEEGRTDALKLVHFHLGSQITSIQNLRSAIKEIGRVYVELVQRGLEVEYLDVGGGLGVNYEAGSIDGAGGINYSMEEYCNSVVYTIQEICESEDVPPPVLVSESGRALTAHHSVLVVEALNASRKLEVEPDFEPSPDDHEAVQELFTLWGSVRLDANSEPLRLNQVLEAYHDAVELRKQADTLFSFGYLDLEQKALAERLYWSVCQAINQRIHVAQPEWLPQELDELDDHLVDQYLCDFSVFQSMMDHWSIGQRFPIMPLHRLDEVPTRRATLVDLTCDSDGKVSRFVAPDVDKHFLEVHPLREGEPYYLGVFLMGAYQDILGDRHNLFGRVTEAHVYADADEPGNYYVEKVLPGATVEEVLAEVQYFPNDLKRRMETMLRQKTKQGVLRPRVAKDILEQFQQGFQEYTYLRP